MRAGWHLLELHGLGGVGCLDEVALGLVGELDLVPLGLQLLLLFGALCAKHQLAPRTLGRRLRVDEKKTRTKGYEEGGRGKHVRVCVLRVQLEGSASSSRTCLSMASRILRSGVTSVISYLRKGRGRGGHGQGARHRIMSEAVNWA